MNKSKTTLLLFCFICLTAGHTLSAQTLKQAKKLLIGKWEFDFEATKNLDWDENLKEQNWGNSKTTNQTFILHFKKKGNFSGMAYQNDTLINQNIKLED